jgi:DNA polymerase III epsilon subunit-like protein
VEVGAVRFRLDCFELTTFQTLINPEVPIPSDVQQVHGITDAMVRGQSTVMLAPHPTAIVDTIAHPRYARPIHEARRVHRLVLPVCRDPICPLESSPMEVT